MNFIFQEKTEEVFYNTYSNYKDFAIFDYYSRRANPNIFWNHSLFLKANPECGDDFSSYWLFIKVK